MLDAFEGLTYRTLVVFLAKAVGDIIISAFASIIIIIIIHIYDLKENHFLAVSHSVGDHL